MLNENKAYELALSSGATLINGKLNVKTGISPELLTEVQANKEDLISYMSGHCFGFQVSYHMAPTQWVVAKVPNIADVDFQPEEVFEGSAHEVDTWCSINKDDPLFSDDYTCKYTIYHKQEAHYRIWRIKKDRLKIEQIKIATEPAFRLSDFTN